MTTPPSLSSTSLYSSERGQNVIDKSAPEDDAKLEKQDNAIAAEEEWDEGINQENVDEDAQESATVDAFKG